MGVVLLLVHQVVQVEVAEQHLELQLAEQQQQDKGTQVELVNHLPFIEVVVEAVLLILVQMALLLETEQMA